MIPDEQLTPHFSLYELTATSHADLQKKNRVLHKDQIGKLVLVAELGELVRGILGVPLKATSGYRCKELNTREGSSSRSQHLLCEAMDFLPNGVDIGVAFRTLWKGVRAGDLKIGQLIIETANRSYGVASWIHISLGVPWRAPERCNQILRMEHATYTLLEDPPPMDNA